MRFPLMSRIAGRHTWDRMSVNFLFIPGVMALGAITAGVVDVLAGWPDPQ